MHITFDAHKNFAYSNVVTPPSPATTGTSLTLTTGHGARFPAAPFNATVWPAGVQPTADNSEIVRVTAISTDTLTIARAQESTSARSIVAGDQIAATVTNKALLDIEQGFNAAIYRSMSVLASDVTNNNATANTLQDVTGLSFAVTSGTIYRFQFFIAYTAAATATGSRWTINGPTTTFLSYRSYYSLTATTETVNFATAYAIPAASNATSAYAGAGNMATIEGIINPSANGTVIARFASEVANSAIVAKAGSTVEWW